jgi:transposase-like protein
LGGFRRLRIRYERSSERFYALAMLACSVICFNGVAPVPRSAFAGFRFPPDVIVLAVRWSLRFGLSYRDVEELLTERGIKVDHVSIYRWVQRFTPLLADAAPPCRHVVGARWWVDETYVKVAGQWRYVYRAIDQFGQVVDVFVSRRRDTTAACRFFKQAIGTTKVPRSRSSPTTPRCTRACSRRWRQQPGIEPTSMPTTVSRGTTAG